MEWQKSHSRTQKIITAPWEPVFEKLNGFLKKYVHQHWAQTNSLFQKGINVESQNKHFMSALLFSLTIIQPKCTSEAIISCNLSSGYNGDRKNVSVVNDNLKSSGSKALCSQVFSHSTMSVGMCFSCFHMLQWMFGKQGTWLLTSKAEFQDHHGRGCGWVISPSCSSDAFPSGPVCWHKTAGAFIPSNGLEQESSDFKPYSYPSRTERQQNCVFVDMILLLNPRATEI